MWSTALDWVLTAKTLSQFMWSRQYELGQMWSAAKTLSQFIWSRRYELGQMWSTAKTLSQFIWSEQYAAIYRANTVPSPWINWVILLMIHTQYQNYQDKSLISRLSGYKPNIKIISIKGWYLDTQLHSANVFLLVPFTLNRCSDFVEDSPPNHGITKIAVHTWIRTSIIST